MSMIGKTLGNFECTALLGKGGMGEVYQAKDQKLGRDVAIKVLPEEFAKDADRVARFQREAKLLASLNHPNIASIYGLEESEGTHFLVLELIKGDTLADRLKRGAIPVEESLKLALQIAEPRRIMRFIHELPEGQQFARNDAGQIDAQMAVSPDGSQCVYATTNGLYLRSMDEFEAKPIPGTDGSSRQPFFSPDGQSIGFFSQSDQKLKKIAISGGPPTVLCDAGPFVLGASWDSEGSIVYSAPLSGGIFWVSASGGAPELLIKREFENMNENGIPIYPQMLPDGKTLLFASVFDLTGDNAQIEVQSLETGDSIVLVNSGIMAKYLPTGHLVYLSTINNSINLYAVPFDPKKLEIGGQVTLLEGIQGVAFSDSGVFVYVSQSAIVTGSDRAAVPGRTLVWVDRKGNEKPLPAEPDEYNSLKISPDGTRVALGIGPNAASDIWVWDFNRESKSRLTFDGSYTFFPVWTPDSQKIIYASFGEGNPGFYSKKADGTGEVEKISPGGADEIRVPFSSSPDGKILALWEVKLSLSQTNISILSMEGDHARTPLLQKEYYEDCPQISPDGRWIAFQSNETGRYEVYVHSFPDVNQGRWQVSTNGGNNPLWSPDGRELFYRSGDSFIAVEVETDPAFKLGESAILFKGAYFSEPDATKYTPWDIHPDGDRFLLLKPPLEIAAEPASQEPVAAGPRKINIVLNWFEELKERVPVP